MVKRPAPPKSPPPMEPIFVRLNADTIRRIDRIAVAEEVNRSTMIRSLLREALSQRKNLKVEP